MKKEAVYLKCKGVVYGEMIQWYYNLKKKRITNPFRNKRRSVLKTEAEALVLQRK